MTWQDIESAPRGKQVRLGKWFIGSTGMVWLEQVGRVWTLQNDNRPWPYCRPISTWVKTSDGDYYTHWMPLPEPPTT